jgi:hypothetical protein
MLKGMYCPCGQHLVARDEDELVRRAQEHLAQEHPQMVGRYGRAEILAFAFDLSARAAGLEEAET